MSTQSISRPNYAFPKIQNDLLFRVINQQPVERVPVWMMRQAGRTDPQYRDLREKDGRPLELLFKDVEQSIEVSLLPKRLGVDAIIMFQDILTPLEPIGLQFQFKPGPVLKEPIRTMSQIEAIPPLDPAKDLNFVKEIIQGILHKLDGELPLLGFAGSPMTLAFFLIAGQSPAGDYDTIFRFIEEHPQELQKLLDTLTTMTIDYLNFQIDAGVHAVQLFESFGDVLPADIYDRYVQPTHEQIFAALNPKAPSILFVKEGNYLDQMIASGAAILSVGQCINLEEALQKAPSHLIFQGNVDNRILLEGSKDDITKAIERCFSQTGKQRLILNLNHGLLAKTPFEHVQHFVNTAKTLGVVDKT